MKRVIAALLTGILLLAHLPISVQAEEYYWEDTAEEIEELGMEGSFKVFPEFGFQLWIPDMLSEVELSDEEFDDGYIARYESDNGYTADLIWTPMDEDTGLLDYAAILDDNGMEYEESTINGMDALLITDEEQDAAVIAFTDRDEDLVELSLYPLSEFDDEFLPNIYAVLSSIQPVLSIYWDELEPELEAYELEGRFVDLDDMMLQFWVPGDMEAAELTDEDLENGFLAYYTDEEGSKAIIVDYIEMTEDEIAAVQSEDTEISDENKPEEDTEVSDENKPEEAAEAAATEETAEDTTEATDETAAEKTVEKEAEAAAKGAAEVTAAEDEEETAEAAAKVKEDSADEAAVEKAEGAAETAAEEAVDEEAAKDTAEEGAADQTAADEVSEAQADEAKAAKAEQADAPEEAADSEVSEEEITEEAQEGEIEDFDIDALAKLLAESGYEGIDKVYINNLPAVTWISEDDDSCYAAFVTTLGNILRFTFTPYSDDDFTEICFYITASIQNLNSEELNWAEYESYLDEVELSGDFQDLGNAGRVMWLPEELSPTELTDADIESGYVGYFISEDEEYAVAAQYIGIGMDLEEYAAILPDYGATEITYLLINGQEAITYHLDETDCVCVSMADEGGYIFEVTFYPASDEDYLAVAEFISASIQAAE